MIAPLLPFPTLSASAAALRGDELHVQAVLALDAYIHLREINYGSKAHSLKWRPAAMWHGYEGALLYWCGELCRHLPQDGLEWRRWVEYWCRAYRASEMAVGPLPWWLGDTAFHLACQAQLIAQDTRYAGNFVHAPLEMAYRWPLVKVGEWQLSL